jgi:hypothetical protein
MPTTTPTVHRRHAPACRGGWQQQSDTTITESRGPQPQAGISGCLVGCGRRVGVRGWRWWTCGMGVPGRVTGGDQGRPEQRPESSLAVGTGQGARQRVDQVTRPSREKRSRVKYPDPVGPVACPQRSSLTGVSLKPVGYRSDSFFPI